MKYRIRAQNAHDLHSPFIYRLYQQVIRKENRQIERDLFALRKQLTKNKGTVVFVDPKTSRTHKKSLRKIAVQSASSHKFSYFLFRLVNFLDYKSVLETGTSLGITTAYLARSSAEQVVSIEGSETLHQLARENLRKLGFDKVKLIRGTVQRVFEKSLAEHKPELVFLDADHRGETILFYLEKIRACASVKCIVIHDIYWSEDMKQTWNKIIENPRYKLTLDLFQAGVIFPDYPMEKQHFSLKF